MCPPIISTYLVFCFSLLFLKKLWLLVLHKYMGTRFLDMKKLCFLGDEFAF